MNPRIINIKNQKFNHLTAISFVKTIDGDAIWLFECDCKAKTRKEIKANNVKYGNIKSCGCLLTNFNKINKTTHNLKNHRLYKIWRAMKSRCHNLKNPGYKNYGGRGIYVNKNWRFNFKIFYDWAINNGYQDNLQINRIDNNQSYLPENCNWVSPRDNSNNRRNNRYILFNNKKQTLQQWLRDLNISRNQFYYRIKKGKSEEEILQEFYVNQSGEDT
jgi:hypothetical protein